MVRKRLLALIWPRQVHAVRLTSEAPIIAQTAYPRNRTTDTTARAAPTVTQGEPLRR